MEMRGDYKLKKEALDRTVGTARCGRGYESVVRKTLDDKDKLKVSENRVVGGTVKTQERSGTKE
jgi:hypothetical protein